MSYKVRMWSYLGVAVVLVVLVAIGIATEDAALSALGMLAGVIAPAVAINYATPDAPSRIGYRGRHRRDEGPADG